MKKPALSIIIPVYNEEFYIANLLASLSTQNFKNFEVIVVDGKSTDKTVPTVKKFKSILKNLELIEVQKRGVSCQRNLGASQAKANILLFLDADVILPFDFLGKSLKGFKQKKADIATCESWPLGKNSLDYLSSFLTNLSLNISHHIVPAIYGWTMFVTKKIHQQIGGFDEKLYFFEDSDYCQRAVKKGAKFAFIKSTSPYVSKRRIEYEGRLVMIKKQLVFAFYYLLYGPKYAQKMIKWKSGDFEKLQRKIKSETLTTRFKKTNKKLRKTLSKIEKLIEEL